MKKKFSLQDTDYREEKIELERKLSDIIHLHSTLLCEVQHEKETIDHRQLRLLKSSNIQLVKQVRNLTQSMNLRNEILNSFESLAYELQNRFKKDIKKPNSDSGFGGEENFEQDLPFLKRFVTNIFNKIKSYKLTISESVSQEFYFGGNKFVQETETSRNLNEVFSLKYGDEIPPFMNVANIAILELKLNQLYKTITKLQTILKNGNGVRVKDGIKNIVLNLQRIKYELVELNVIVPVKFPTPKNHQFSKPKLNDNDNSYAFGGKNGKDEFELNWTLKKLSSRFFKTRKDYNKKLRSIIQCYKKMKNLWKLEQEVLKDELEYVKKQNMLILHGKTNNEFENETTHTRDDYEGEEMFDETFEDDIELKENRREIDSNFYQREENNKDVDELKEYLKEILEKFSQFDEDSNQGNLKGLLVYLKKNSDPITQLLQKPTKSERPQSNTIIKQTPTKKKTPKRTPKSNKSQRLSKKETEKELKYIKLEFENKKQDQERKIYKLQEKLLLEEMYMDEKPKGFVPMNPIKKSKILTVNHHGGRREIDNPNLKRAPGSRSGGGLVSRDRERERKVPKKKSNFVEMTEQYELIESGVKSLEEQINSTGITSMQKYALKKMIKREKAKLIKIERTLKELS